jgi:hypothetical protein
MVFCQRGRRRFRPKHATACRVDVTSQGRDSNSGQLTFTSSFALAREGRFLFTFSRAGGSAAPSIITRGARALAGGRRRRQRRLAAVEDSVFRFCGCGFGIEFSRSRGRDEGACEGGVASRAPCRVLWRYGHAREPANETRISITTAPVFRFDLSQRRSIAV